MPFTRLSQVAFTHRPAESRNRRLASDLDLSDDNLGMLGRESAQIDRVMSEDDSSAQSNGGRNHERIDGMFTICSNRGKQVSRYPSNAGARGDDLGKALSEDTIDWLVISGSSIELDQHCRRHTHRVVATMCTAQRRTHLLVTFAVLAGPSEAGKCFGVEN